MKNFPELVALQKQLRELEDHISEIWSKPKHLEVILSPQDITNKRESLFERIGRFFATRL